MTKSFWVLLWISIHTLLHLFQTWPLLTSRVWAKGQQQNSQQNMWLPEPRMGNLAQASSHTNFTSCTGSYHSISILICLPWQKEKCLESFLYEQKDEAPQVLFETAGFQYIFRWKRSLQARAEQEHPPISARHHLSTAHRPPRQGNYGKHRQLIA